MALLPRPLDRPEQRDAFNRATRWLQLLARVGYASKGIVYIVMGALAVRAAFRVSSDFVSFRGSLLRIVDRPFGHTMLAVLAIGFAGYAAWQIISALIDVEDSGEGRNALFSRVEQIFTGVIYASLAKVSGHLLFEDESTAVEIEYHWGTWLARMPGGHAGLALAGACILSYGLYQFWRARSERALLKRVLLPSMAGATRRVIVSLGRFGLVTRGVVFGMLGWLLVRAGIRGDHSVGSSLGDALRALGEGPAGMWVLAVVAAGLMAHGGYQFINARYRRLRERRLWKLPRRSDMRGNDRRAHSPPLTPTSSD